MHKLLYAVVILLSASVLASGNEDPPPVLTHRPDATTPAGASELLGPEFVSASAGISFHPPAGCRMIQQTGTDEIVRFVNSDKKWVLKVSRLSLSKPVPLTTTLDGQKETEGILQITASNIKTEAPGAEILRQEAFDHEKFNPKYAMLVVRYALGTQSNLAQQALVQASPQLYYHFNLTIAASMGDDLSTDPNVKLAADTFSAMIDTVKLLDQTQLREDQVDRLFRTRSLFVNLTEARLRSAIVPEQWLRLIRDGKDIGYTYVVEEPAHDLPRKGVNPNSQGGKEGVLVGVRSRTIPGAGAQVDVESWMFCAFDRTSEAWAGFAVSTDATNTKAVLSESGTSVKQVRLTRDGSIVDPKDNRNPGMAPVEDYHLQVSHAAKNISPKPVTRDLPPFYLPQALGQMIPRLVPRSEAKSYLFATYVSERREVMMRYVEVGAAKDVKLDGNTVRAIPITDKIGLEGSITTHYISPEGKYLGSVNPDTKITVLPTDQPTLEKLWKDVDLSRPKEVDEKK